MPKHLFKTSLRNAAVGLAGILAVASGTAAQAATTSRIGWVWASNPTDTSPYTPDPSYSYNSAGGAITITRLDAGYYAVQFAKLSTGVVGGDVQATEYSGSGYCMASGWSFTTNGRVVTAYVNCYDASGNASDSYFTLLYQFHSGNIGNAGKGLAYLRADQPSAGSYTPTGALQYNSTGASNTVVRHTVGDYTVTLPGLTRNGGSVQVTAFLGNAAGRCKVSGLSGNSNGTSVDVLCFDSVGNSADEAFDLAYSDRESFGYTNSATARGAYALTTKPLDKSSYTPTLAFQYNGFGTGNLAAIKGGKGIDTVSIPGDLTYNTSNVLVTSFDSTTNYCNVHNWGASTIVVFCYAQGGVPADTKFNVAFQTAN
jgi:hypothetical protein